MADFLESEASEVEDDEELTEKERKKLKKMKAMDDSEEESEDDDDKLREELKDLIDDNPIEEDDSGSESDGSGGSRKRSRDDEDDELDDRLEDEDYELLEENLGVKVQRNRYKRVKRIEDEDSDDEDHPEHDREVIANELFESGDEGEQEEQAIHEEEAPEAEGSEEEGEEEDVDDFIVDDDGKPIARAKKKRKPIFADAALQEAQDIFGVDFDFDEFEKYGEDGELDEEEEEEEEFDEEEGEGVRRTKAKKSKKKTGKQSIYQIYEPSELEKSHFTDLDNEIRQTDIPERMQLRASPVTPTEQGADDPELDEEAEWIYQRAFISPTITCQPAEYMRKGPSTVGKIRKALDFMRNQHLEVPFIAFYRKEYVVPELNINDLWKVYKWDEKWCQLMTRRNNLERLFEKMQQYQGEKVMAEPDKPLAAGFRSLQNEDISRLKMAQSSEELKDIYLHFLLYYAQDIPAMHEAVRKKKKEEAREKKKKKEEGGEEEEEAEESEDPEEEDEPEYMKHAIRNDVYSLCKRAEIDGFVEALGLAPEQFAENLRDNYQRHEVDQCGAEPLEEAKKYVSNRLKTAEDVLKAAKFMVATQLCREPLVRRCVREVFFERAKLTISPTKKGIKILDENHYLYNMKYVKDKPVRDLTGEQCMKIFMAEEEKLITVEFGESINGLTAETYVDEAKQLYYRDEFSKNVQEWNTIRGECVEMAFTRFLYPVFRKELRLKLTNESKDYIIRACCRKLYTCLRVSGYTNDVTFADDDDEDADDPETKNMRIMSIAYLNDMDLAAYTCIVNSEGECTDFLKLQHLLKRKNAWRDIDREEKEADLLALRHFISTKSPHVILISGESKEALMILEDVRGVVNQLVEEEEQFPAIPVEIVDNEVSKIYMNTAKAESDFRDYPPLLRQAISMSRRMHDPLAEYSQLCNSEEDILCLRYHTLQDRVPKEELMEALTLEFVNRTNEVGVDVNQAINLPYMSNLVQFVCGLGPRKAAALLKTLKQSNQALESRTQLVTACHMGPKVFINCAGFIKIDTNSLSDNTEAYIEVLDSSRVHPETYEWARKMAVDAALEDEEDNPAGALDEILEHPERLKELDLDAFADELKRQGFGDRSITLYDIRAELSHRYKDLRCPFVPPNPEEIFNMLTKETPETFYIGKMVLCKVIGFSHRKPKGEQLDQANPVRNNETGLWQCPFCLKNDFPELSEVWNHFDAGSCPGQAIGVRVRLDNGIFGLIQMRNLSDKTVTNPEERVQWGQLIHARIMKIDVEKFWVECTCKSSDLADKNNEWKPSKDPFYDYSAEEAVLKAEKEKRQMKQKQTYVKRVIVHPSFHNIGYKETEKLVAQMDQGEAVIRPSSKGSDHLTVTWKVAENVYQHIDVKEERKENAFSLGQNLMIGQEEFEDLDEILARFVGPMAAHARDLLSFRYYKDVEGGRAKMEELLKEEKKRNSTKIHYFVTVSKEYPGKFLLSYLPRSKCRHEFITVTPEGFRFRLQMFETVASLFKWFKEHFRDPVPNTPRMTGRTPYATPSFNLGNVNPETIQRVAQNIPGQMLHNLSQAANRTPHFAHTPSGYSQGYGYANTPYTPSGQTPFMTPYATPRMNQTPQHQPGGNTPYATPRHHAQTPTHPGSVGGNNTPYATPRHQPQTPRYGSTQRQQDAMDWGKAAEAWAKSRQETGRSTPGRSTPRYGESGGSRYTPRYDDRSSSRSSHTDSPRIQGSYGRSPRPNARSTPRSTPRPRGDATPLYDE